MGGLFVVATLQYCIMGDDEYIALWEVCLLLLHCGVALWEMMCTLLCGRFVCCCYIAVLNYGR